MKGVWALKTNREWAGWVGMDANKIKRGIQLHWRYKEYNWHTLWKEMQQLEIKLQIPSVQDK